jgi:hypothetical protein
MFLTSPLLTYAVATDPFPLLASPNSGNLNKARFTVVATNGTGGDVVMDGIIVQFPIGTEGNCLTLDPTAIGAVPPESWNLSSAVTEPGRYIFTPYSGYATVPNGEALAFVFNNIEVNRAPGTFAMEITEATGNCDPDCPVYTTWLTKFPTAWGQVQFWANPVNISWRGTTTLYWAGPAGATYSIEYMMNGRVVRVPALDDPAFANQGQYPGVLSPPLTLDATTVFTLSVSRRIDNEEFRAQAQVTVSVASPPAPRPNIVKFYGSVAMDGSQLQLTLDWVTELAEEITITHVSGLQKRSDTLIIRPSLANPLQGSYTLEARKGSEAVTSIVTIVWVAAKNVRFGSVPGSCAILPNGSRIFSLTSLQGGSVSVFDPVTLGNISGSPFTLNPALGAFSIAASPDSSRVYVTMGKYFTCNDSGDFHSVPGSPVFTYNWGDSKYLAVTPDNRRLYVSGSRNSVSPPEVWVYDTSNWNQVGAIPLSGYAHGIAFSPDGLRAFVPSNDGTVAVIDTVTLTRTNSIAMGGVNVSAAVTPDGMQLYVGNQTAKSVSVFDPRTLLELPGSPVAMGGSPVSLVPSRDGKLMFALVGYGPLRVIDTTTRTVLGSSELPYNPVGLAVLPDGIRVFVILNSMPGEMWMYLPAATGGTTSARQNRPRFEEMPR